MENDIIDVPSMHGAVYSKLREQLTSGKIRPGEKITIRQVADSFGVSTMPVREALRQLQTEGLVVFGRRSISVRQLQPLEVKQIFAIRERLELLATEWALPNVRKGHRDRLDALVQDMDSAQSSPDDWRRLNEEFHFFFYKQCNSEILFQSIETLWKTVDSYMSIYTTGVDSLAHAQEQHHAMVDLIKKSDLPALLNLIMLHLQETMETILATLGSGKGK